ncbi:hypothetical protein [Actinomycetospora soli]|uniref:hypothetical protein n=1 Tax=Actinomycetospora soli TaxID=2893887 RepID=UPI001E3B52AD|nr:hypothetical protein [Actinomycetospora soli]MCD2186638.1 hypothetical protein [Actinomycetospora soli]
MTDVHDGQVWSYRTRPGEEHSRLRVLLTDSDPVLGHIVHVSVRDVVIPNSWSDSGYTTWITHVPLSQEAFERSAIDLLGTDPGEPDLEGYRTWRDENGGVFTLSLAEVVDHVQYALRVVAARHDEP